MKYPGNYKYPGNCTSCTLNFPGSSPDKRLSGCNTIKPACHPGITTEAGVSVPGQSFLMLAFPFRI